MEMMVLTERPWEPIGGKTSNQWKWYFKSDTPILDIDGQKSLTVSAWFKSSGNHRQFILQKKNINTIGTYRPGYLIDLNNLGHRFCGL